MQRAPALTKGEFLRVFRTDKQCDGAKFLSIDLVGSRRFQALIDRFGWLGQPVVPLSADRLIAIALLVASLLLLVRR